MGKYKELLVNIGLFAINSFATKIITFLLIPLYTAYLSSSEYGISDMATTVINMIGPLATLSISAAVLRFALEQPQKREEYMAIGFWIVFLSCGVIALLLPFLNFPIFGGLGEYKLLFLLTYITSTFQDLFNNEARALNEVKIIPLASIVSATLTAICAVGFIAILSLGIRGYFYSILIGSVAGIIVYLWKARLFRYIKFISKDIIKKDLRIMMIYAAPLIPNALFWWIGTSINRFFITGMIGIAATGMYAAATKIPSILDIVGNIFQQAWTLSAFQQYKKTDISAFFSKIFLIYQNGLIFVGSGIMLFTPLIAKFLLQKEFFNAWYLVPILLLAFYFNSMNAFYGTVFTSTMKTSALFTTTVAGSITVILGSWLLIRPMGLIGAVSANALANLIVLILRTRLSKKLIRIQVNWPIVIPSILLYVIQGIIMSMKIPNYLIWSGIITSTIGIVAIYSLAPIAKQIVNRKKNKIC